MTATQGPEGAPVEVRRTRAADEEERRAFVAAHPQATFFHQRGWARFVERTWGHGDRELVACRDGRIVGVLPLMSCPAGLGGTRLVSSPYAVYGGPLALEPRVTGELARAAHELGRSERARYVELRCLEDPGLGWPGTALYWTFQRELPREPGEVLARMPKKARAEARKGRERFALELGQGSWYVRDLARLFERNKQALGSPALPLAHFEGLLAEFRDACFVHVVRDAKRPIAAVLSLAFRDTLVAYYAGSEAGADREKSASNFMYLALQEWAVERGFRVFDFCRSRADSGAFAFKRHQGFEPTALNYRFDLLRDGKVPDFHPSNPRTRLLRRVWSRLPVGLARALSKPLAKRLS
jgi:FemAB-related protein (PEP-CTERM system-associated)